MPRFYFIVHDELGEAPDDEGAELPSLEAAIVRATQGARSIMSDAVKSGKLDLSGRIDIERADRMVVTRVNYAEALTVKQ